VFRVTIRGTFDRQSGGEGSALPAGADPTQVAFTEAGTFTVDANLSAFTFRCQVPAGPDDGEEHAARRAVAALDAHGHPYRLLRMAVTDMRDIKVRRKHRQR
jgi:hypothetical protein